MVIFNFTFSVSYIIITVYKFNIFGMKIDCFILEHSSKEMFIIFYFINFIFIIYTIYSL